MKTKIPFLCALVLCGTASLQAQEGGGRGARREGEHEHGEGQRGQGGPGGGGPGGFMARLPVMKALDKDQDGALSAEEIAGASAALLTLDKDGDGELSAEEIRPVMQQRGESPHQIAERTFEAFDKNKDGKITADELPERMKAMLERADANKDGAVTEQELEKLIEKETPQQQGPREGGRPEGAPREGEAPKPGA